MKVTMFNFTPNPLETFWIARKSQQNITPNSIKEVECTITQTDLEENYLELLNEGLTSPMEFVSTQWKLEGCSRELQQQITRHRIGISFSIESMRVVPKNNFADTGQYRSFKHLSKRQQQYMESAMQDIQSIYMMGAQIGIPTQDLRAMLPLATTSVITMSAAWNSLFGLINKRLCLKAQEEIRELGVLMTKEICDKLPPVMSTGLLPPCAKGWCVISPENKKQYAKGKLDGVQNTDHICPIWMEIHHEKKNPELLNWDKWGYKVVGRKIDNQIKMDLK